MITTTVHNEQDRFSYSGEKFGGPPQKKKNVVADFDEPESGPPQKKKAVPVFDDGKTDI